MWDTATVTSLEALALCVLLDSKSSRSRVFLAPQLTYWQLTWTAIVWHCYLWLQQIWDHSGMWTPHRLSLSAGRQNLWQKAWAWQKAWVQGYTGTLVTNSLCPASTTLACPLLNRFITLCCYLRIFWLWSTEAINTECKHYRVSQRVCCESTILWGLFSTRLL